MIWVKGEGEVVGGGWWVVGGERVDGERVGG
jgi:hypothetical protein